MLQDQCISVADLRTKTFEQPDLIELPEAEVTPQLRKEAARAGRSKKADQVNLQ